jgi:hypothetical protein
VVPGEGLFERQQGLHEDRRQDGPRLDLVVAEHLEDALEPGILQPDLLESGRTFEPVQPARIAQHDGGSRKGARGGDPEQLAAEHRVPVLARALGQRGLADRKGRGAPPAGEQVLEIGVVRPGHEMQGEQPVPARRLELVGLVGEAQRPAQGVDHRPLGVPPQVIERLIAGHGRQHQREDHQGRVELKDGHDHRQADSRRRGADEDRHRTPAPRLEPRQLGPDPAVVEPVEGWPAEGVQAVGGVGHDPSLTPQARP